MTFSKFIRQPTTVGGIATILGVASAWLIGSMSWQAAIPSVIGAVVAILIPDNTSVEHDAEAIAKAAVQAYLDASKGGAPTVR
jgi:hypothetical protein